VVLTLFSTLIAVFVTSSGVLIGSDTAVVGKNRNSVDVVKKTCQVGPTSVAGISGTTGWYVRTTLVDLTAKLQIECERLKLLPELTIDQRAQELADALVQFARTSGPPVRGTLTTSNTGTLVQIVVAGLESGAPRIVATGLDYARRAFTPKTSAVFDGCFIFMGYADVPRGLLRESPLLPVPEAARSAVAEVRQQRAPRCTVSPSSARAFFELAVDMSREHAGAIGIPTNSINRPLYFEEIVPDGELHTERVP
jgi:hypothetical protein